MMVEFSFGDAGDTPRGTLGAGLALLSGERSETLLHEAAPHAGEQGLSLWTGPEGMVGFARVGTKDGLEAATERTYRSILRATAGLNLYRIWNFVPDINGGAGEGLENYRSFCRGRSVAFEAGLGPGFTRSLPAASAVGTESRELTVAFLAGRLPASHHENPVQTPAYDYPPEHGPRSPSFSRATVVDRSDGAIDAYVSGTSAVVGHETVAPDDTAGQLECTLANLRLISRACGLGEQIGRGGACRRYFKVYLRHAGDLGVVQREMRSQGFLADNAAVSYLRADICRAALNVEIEVAARGAMRT